MQQKPKLISLGSYVETMGNTMWSQTEYRTMWLGAILWPSFLGALLLSLIVFIAVDPAQLQFLGHVQLSRATAYTLGFFVFWFVGGLTNYLAVKLLPPRQQDDDF